MFGSRLLETESDFERMKDLLRDNYCATRRIAYPGPCDLEFWRYMYDESPDLIRRTQLWEDDDGRLMAFVWMSPDGSDYAVRAGAEALISEILAWSEKTRLGGDLLGESFDSNRIQIGADREDEIALARGLGYKPSGIRSAIFVRDLARASADPPPPGVVVRSLERRDLETRSRLAELAQNQEVKPANYERLLLQSPLYRRHLDIVAEVEGELAAFCTGWADPRTKLGLLEPFGCRAEYRRRGITRAVVSECLRRLAAFGMERVYTTHGGLGIDEPEDDTTRFNAAMGFGQIAGGIELVKEELRPWP